MANNKKHNRNHNKPKNGEIAKTPHWKIYLYVGIIFIIIAAAVVLRVVLQDKGPAESELIGKWETVNSYDLHVEFDFNEDHTLKYLVSDNLEYSGTWSYNRYTNLSKITIIINDDDVQDKEMFLIDNEGEIILSYDTEDFQYAYHKAS